MGLYSEVESFYATNQILCSLLLWGNPWILMFSLPGSAPRNIVMSICHPSFTFCFFFLLLSASYHRGLCIFPIALPSCISFLFLRVVEIFAWGECGDIQITALARVIGVQQACECSHDSGKGCPWPLVVISISSTLGKTDYSVPRNIRLGPGWTTYYWMEATKRMGQLGNSFQERARL